MAYRSKEAVNEIHNPDNDIHNDFDHAWGRII